MGSKKTVDDLLEEKGVTPEEMEILKDIIEECREREKTIDHSVNMLRTNLKMLFDSIGLLNKKAERLLSSMEDLKESLGTLYLLILPKEKFYIE